MVFKQLAHDLLYTPCTHPDSFGKKPEREKQARFHYIFYMAANDSKETPAMKQYFGFKKQHPDCVLFFRMGDFYEMFYDDAILANKVLGVTLTQRTAGQPMAGVPYHAVEGYLRRMIQAGYRVAVCDQVEDPAQAKGLVKRDVTRLITPGTLTDEALLEEGRENPLAAVVFHDEERASIAWAELSTGSFWMTSLAVKDLADELARVAPRELLYVQTADNLPPTRIKTLATSLGCTIAGRPGWQFRTSEAFQTLCRQFQVTTLHGFGIEQDHDALGAAGAVIHYLLETQKTGPEGRITHLRPPRLFERQAHLVIDQTSLRSLEVERTIRSGQTDGTLLGVMQCCVTAMGKRLLRQWLCYPLCDRQAIEARQQSVAAMVSDSRFLEELRTHLSNVQDVQRIAGRMAVGRATPRDLVALGNSAQQAMTLAQLLQGQQAMAGPAQAMAQVAQPLTSLAQAITQACVESAPNHLREGGLVRDGFDAQLDEYRLLQRDSNTWLAQYQQQLITETGLNGLKVGYNKVFGFYIEISAAKSDMAPASWSRKQTLKNAERFITPQLKEYEGKVLSAEQRAIAREQEIFAQLCALAQDHLPLLHEFAQAVAELDVLACFARQAVRRRYVQPVMVDEPVLQITAGRHPVLDDLLGDQFVPNDVELTGQQSLGLITGPNMAGKSTYIRQTALITLLAHTGSFVPAQSATIGMCDRIFTRIGASDELHAGASTFMVEMTETANICHHASPSSLVILDEIGRGTSTLDGLSLAWAIAEHLAMRQCRTLFATHYHELTTLAESYPNVMNLNVTVREWADQIVFLHRIVPGATDRSYGIHVAKIAGLPAEVVSRANELLGLLSVNHASSSTQAAVESSAQKSRGKQQRNDGQLSLFTEYIEHPAMLELRKLNLDTLSPMQAFDLLRKLQQQINQD
jgi:DNA mismatch repair protein MutS